MRKVEGGEARVEARKCGNAERRVAKHRDVCVLIPRPSRPLFIGFRCRILRQTLSQRVPRRPPRVCVCVSCPLFSFFHHLFSIAPRFAPARARASLYLFFPPPCFHTTFSSRVCFPLFYSPDTLSRSRLTRKFVARPINSRDMRTGLTGWAQMFVCGEHCRDSTPFSLSSSMLPLFHATKVSAGLWPEFANELLSHDPEIYECTSECELEIESFLRSLDLLNNAREKWPIIVQSRNNGSSVWIIIIIAYCLERICRSQSVVNSCTERKKMSSIIVKVWTHGSSTIFCAFECKTL